MDRTQRKIVLRIDSPCPCGSGKTIANCHLDIDGRFRKRCPSLRSPAPATGFSHPSCYLRGTCDCSAQLSREHYISKSVLEQLGEAVAVSGTPWLDPGHTLELAIGNLTAKILCKRHNEALSPLDTEAAHYFSVLTKALLDLKRRTQSRKPMFHLVSGDALELWMLKVACGTYFSIAAKGRIKIAETHTIDLEKVQRAFFECKWDARAGLYFRGTTGTVIDVSDRVALSPLTNDVERSFNGVTILLRGFGLEFIFDTKNTNFGPWHGLVRRPTELVLQRHQRQHNIILTWPPGTPEASIRMVERNRS